MKSRIRQAVVVIHGIGEQRPMSTLRGFVDSLITDEQGKKVPVYNRPDELSDLFELRTLSVYPHHGSPRTDFYEYYWAYTMRGTKFMHVITWLTRLLFRWYTNVPKRIRWLYFLFWIMVAILTGGLATGILRFEMFLENWWETLIGTALYLVINIVGFFLIHYLGDAARYTDASADNIEERQKIRANGIALLKQLHTCGNYDRIIVVGHSLGSIIGYDLIKNLWAQYNQTHSSLDVVQQPVMEAFEKKYGRTDPARHPEPFDAKTYQLEQDEVLKEQHALGNNWLISDFVTLGSPLTYASMLLADTEKELRQRIVEREVPISPPIAEKEATLSYPKMYTSTTQNMRTIKVLHHATPFACVRWHNAYYTNDFVGGSLTKLLGPGIDELKMKVKKFCLGLLPFVPHTWYWGDEGKSHEREAESIRWLKQIILPVYKDNKSDK